MAFNFVKLTQRGGKPVYINIDHVAAVHEDFSQPMDADTIVLMAGSDDSYYRVREKVEAVVDKIYDAKQE